MPVLAALPLWAYVYQATLEPAPTGELTPVEEGGEIYRGRLRELPRRQRRRQRQRPGASTACSRPGPTSATT